MKRRGFTITEVLVAAGLTAVVFASLLPLAGLVQKAMQAHAERQAATARGWMADE